MSQRVSRSLTAVSLTGVMAIAVAGAVQAETTTRTDRELIAKRVAPQVAVQGVSVEQYYDKQAVLNNWLLSELPAESLDRPISIVLSEKEIAEIDNVDASQPGPMRVGVVRELEKPVVVSFRNAASARADDIRDTRDGGKATKAAASVEMTDDGGFVWARSVISQGAVALRVKITDLSLPADADLYVFNVHGEAYGPFQRRGPNGDGEVWLPSVMSDEAIIMVRHFGPDGAADLRNTSLRISAVGHIGRGFPGAQNNVDGGVAAFCSFNASCVENASCHDTGPAAAAEGAAAKMLWVAGCCINICTGGLLADTDSSSEIPYFLTANHCLSKDNDASSLEAYFQYSVSCGAGCPVGTFEAPPAPKTVGASVVSTNRTGDYSLLQLSQSPPSGSVFLGWNSAPVAFTGGANLFRIHHPSGAPQAYSEHSVDTGAGTCRGWPRGERIYSNDLLGATEGGSSGSPVVNASGEVVGQLSGCCGFNCGDVCDSGSNSTVDGAFAHYFPEVEPFLDPGNGGCTPTTVSCSDGVDNDCDGAVDCDDTDGDEDCSADPNCDGGSDPCVNPGGLASGESCTADGDCCSDKCKGPPNNRTCR